MTTRLTAMKAELKEQAIKLRTTKEELKECQRANPYGAYKAQWLKAKEQSEYRHKHIVYCLLRGTPYERIETPKEGNEPSWAIIDRLKEEYSYAEENVCASAQ